VIRALRGGVRLRSECELRKEGGRGGNGGRGCIIFKGRWGRRKGREIYILEAYTLPNNRKNKEITSSTLSHH